MEDNVVYQDSIYAESDVGNLCLFNLSSIKEENKSGEQWIKDLAVKGVKCLFEKIYALPSEYHDHVPVAKLPQPTIIIPREKPVPMKRPPTKWEQFAKKKGIVKRKKDKLAWDPKGKDWKPTYGFKSAKNEEQRDWLVEVPDNADPNVDYFAKKKDNKAQTVAKNEYQRLRNIAVATKTKVNNMESLQNANKHQLSRALASAKTSTASVGKFTKSLPKEKPPKNVGIKRKFAANIPSSMNDEKESNLKILAEMGRKAPKLDIKEAVQLDVAKKMKPERKNSKPKKKPHHQNKGRPQSKQNSRQPKQNANWKTQGKGKKFQKRGK